MLRKKTRGDGRTAARGSLKALITATMVLTLWISFKIEIIECNAGWVVGQPNNWDNEQHCALYDANIRGRKTNGFKIAKKSYRGKDILTVSE